MLVGHVRICRVVILDRKIPTQIGSMLDMHADTEISSGLFYIKTLKLLKINRIKNFVTKRQQQKQVITYETKFEFLCTIWARSTSSLDSTLRSSSFKNILPTTRPGTAKVYTRLRTNKNKVCNCYISHISFLLISHEPNTNGETSLVPGGLADDLGTGPGLLVRGCSRT